MQLLQMIRSDLNRGPEMLKCILLQYSTAVIVEESGLSGFASTFAQPVAPTDFFNALCRLDQQKPAHIPATILPPVAKPTQCTQKRVLIAEDNPTNMLYTRYLVEQLVHGAEIIEACNGEEALEVFLHAQPNIILMDLQMPVMSGEAATREIRQRELASGTGRTPIIAFTANAIRGVREQCLASGFDDYITKPVVKEELLRILELFI
jgi:CheY-like chemotaxis protein